ncbi:MAG: RNA-binding transcriptional accessory protein [Bacteroidaceae bacterium]|nr:RNA-binding transcriptional accessory protein [Bacteroidaceae bacterium]MBQ5706437.1 RNA-binding transcriptional accessory protein [Bacteroidaceae bacterium]MBQ5817738.1 RNA-binding transcriptional accessory protein [Bacteroidaceae bacterium]
MLADIIAKELGIGVKQVRGTVELLMDGATVPFIARYRKEATGSLDEVAIGKIKELHEKYSELQRRKETVIATIDEQGKLTEELKKRITECFDSVELEDIYLPFRPKRRTRATIARERGLEPLADIIFAQQRGDAAILAKNYINEDVATAEDALAGACDIIAERVSEDEYARSVVRRSFNRYGAIKSKVIKGKEAEGIKYSDYYEASAQVARVSSHRVLAMMRGEEEGILRLSVSVEPEYILEQLSRHFIKRNSATRQYMTAAIEDGYKRLLEPSIENETKNVAKERADDEAIAVFAENLRQLLLSAPLGQKRVLAIDPGFRTGCKVVVLDSQGNLVTHSVIYPHPPQNDREGAAAKIEKYVKEYDIQAFAIGNGTAGRETEQFVRRLGLAPQIFVVNEDGASVYSASAVAREEFPNEDVTVRGAVSIGRRLIDPLSELVKIEPRSIGVGQYQHSVDQTKLKDRLDTVVESCVNLVGVNVNTATKQILTHISGLGPALAANIVNYRAANGDFRTRKELLKVPRLGSKAFEQSAGFLRVIGGSEPLDATAVHPESYAIVAKMAKDCGVSVNEFVTNSDIRTKVNLRDYITDTVGLPTLTDIMDALKKRGLDPREQATEFSFDASVHEIEDLKPGMVLPGIVSNITAFGAFVNIGVHQDGLVHISQLTNKFVSSPSEVVKLGQQVMVKVTDVDLNRKRISLTMKDI